MALSWIFGGYFLKHFLEGSVDHIIYSGSELISLLYSWPLTFSPSFGACLFLGLTLAFHPSSQPANTLRQKAGWHRTAAGHSKTTAAALVRVTTERARALS